MIGTIITLVNSKFVADFIGRSNFLEATVASENEVVFFLWFVCVYNIPVI